MPIRLNLLAEQQEAEDARRRDPVKRTLWVAGLLVGIALLWCIYLFANGQVASSRLRKQELALANLQPDFAQATNTLNRLNTFEDRIAALNKYASNRFLWGNTLNGLQYAALEDVQVLTISGQQDLKKGDEVRTNTTIAITAYMRGGKLATPLTGITNAIRGRTTLLMGDTNTSYTNIEIATISLNWWQFKTPPAATNSIKITPEKTAIIREQIRVLINGKVFGDSPIRVADRFKANILTNPYFSRVLRRDGVNVISGLDSPQPDEKETNRLSSPFTLECIFADRVRR